MEIEATKNTTQKAKNKRATQTPPKTGGEFGCFDMYFGCQRNVKER